MHRLKEQEIRRAILILRLIILAKTNLTLKDFAEATSTSPSVMSKLIAKLNRLGIVESPWNSRRPYKTGPNAKKYLQEWSVTADHF